jgi:hypothetical protein
MLWASGCERGRSRALRTSEMESASEIQVAPRRRKTRFLAAVFVALVLVIAYAVLSGRRTQPIPLQVAYFSNGTQNFGPHLRFTNLTDRTVGLFNLQLQTQVGAGWSNCTRLPLPFGGLIPPHGSSRLRLDVLGGKPSGPAAWRVHAYVDKSLKGLEQSLPRIGLFIREGRFQSVLNTNFAFYTEKREMTFPVIDPGASHR